jgi:hypothetical protein
MTRRATLTVADITRALKAAARLGRHSIVEILPDGTIRIVNETEKPVAPVRESVL